MKLTTQRLKKLIREELKKINEQQSGADPDIVKYIDEVYKGTIKYYDDRRSQDESHIMKWEQETLRFLRRLRGNTELAMLSNDFEPKHLNLRINWSKLIAGTHDTHGGTYKSPGYIKFHQILEKTPRHNPDDVEKYNRIYSQYIVGGNYRSWEEIPRDIYENPRLPDGRSAEF